MNNITVGDLITSSHEGFFIVVRIDYTHNTPAHNAVVHCIKVANHKGYSIKHSKEYTSDVNDCHVVTRCFLSEDRAAELRHVQQTHDRIADTLTQYLTD